MRGSHPGAVNRFIRDRSRDILLATRSTGRRRRNSPRCSRRCRIQAGQRSRFDRTVRCSSATQNPIEQKELPLPEAQLDRFMSIGHRYSPQTRAPNPGAATVTADFPSRSCDRRGVEEINLRDGLGQNHRLRCAVVRRPGRRRAAPLPPPPTKRADFGGKGTVGRGPRAGQRGAGAQPARCSKARVVAIDESAQWRAGLRPGCC